MNGLNNDIPSPVEEGVVDSIKNFFGRNKAITVDTSAIKSDINSALQQITSLANFLNSEVLAKGLYKVSSGSMEVYDEHYKTIGDLNDKRFSEIPIKAGQELHVNIGEIQFWKIFPNKDRLDRSPGAERGDLSPEGKEFDRIVNKFSKALDEKVKSDKYKISIEWLVDWDDNNYDVVFKFVPRNYIKNDGGIKESFSSVSDKESVQEELFPILTGKELPVREMSDGAADALAVAGTFGIIGLGLGLFSLAAKGVNKLFGRETSNSENIKITSQDAAKLKQLGQDFMETQEINSAERRKVYNEAIKLLKQYYPKEYTKQHCGISLIGGEWNDPSDFYKGKINICDIGFITSARQTVPGYDEILKKGLSEDEEEKQHEILRNKYHKTIRGILNSINKDLTKKYKGKYRVYFEDFDDYWDIYGEGDGDEGAIIIADVDMINRMKSYISNHAIKESTEVVSESTNTDDYLCSPELKKEREEVIKVAKAAINKYFPREYKKLLFNESELPDYQFSNYFSGDPLNFKDCKYFGAYLIGGIDDPHSLVNDKLRSIRDYKEQDHEYTKILEKEIKPTLREVENNINEELDKKGFKKYKVAIQLVTKCFYSSERDFTFISLVDTRYCNLNADFKANAKKVVSKINDMSKDLSSNQKSADDEYNSEEVKKKRKAIFEKAKKLGESLIVKCFPKVKTYLSFYDGDLFIDKPDRADIILDIETDDYIENVILPLHKKEIEVETAKIIKKSYPSLKPGSGEYEHFANEIRLFTVAPRFLSQYEKKLETLVNQKAKFEKDYILFTEHRTDINIKHAKLCKEEYSLFIDDANIVTEGWGVAFTRFAVKHNLPFANKLEDKIWEWSESTVNQLTNIPEFKEYILREAPKAYDEAYLRNNNLSINVNADMISEFEEEYEDSEAYHKVDKKNCCFCKKIGKFYVGVFGDKSHIHGVWLLMSDSKNKKIYAKALPAPEKELNKFKYQK